MTRFLRSFWLATVSTAILFLLVSFSWWVAAQFFTNTTLLILATLGLSDLILFLFFFTCRKKCGLDLIALMGNQYKHQLNEQSTNHLEAARLASIIIFAADERTDFTFPFAIEVIGAMANLVIPDSALTFLSVESAETSKYSFYVMDDITLAPIHIEKISTYLLENFDVVVDYVDDVLFLVGTIDNLLEKLEDRLPTVTFIRLKSLLSLEDK